MCSPYACLRFVTLAKPNCHLPHSNQRAEIYAVTCALAAVDRAVTKYVEKRKLEIRPVGKIAIFSDSEYVVKACTVNKEQYSNEGIPGANADLFKRAFKWIDAFQRSGWMISIKWVAAHVGIEGNERADILAKEGADLAYEKWRKENPPMAAPIASEIPTTGVPSIGAVGTSLYSSFKDLNLSKIFERGPFAEPPPSEKHTTIGQAAAAQSSNGNRSTRKRERSEDKPKGTDPEGPSKLLRNSYKNDKEQKKQNDKPRLQKLTE